MPIRHDLDARQQYHYPESTGSCNLHDAVLSYIVSTPIHADSLDDDPLRNIEPSFVISSG
jgi:hypothetical protein